MIRSVTQAFFEMERGARELSAQQIADLFEKHDLKPVRQTLFGVLGGGNLPTQCCGLGAILVDMLVLPENRDLAQKIPQNCMYWSPATIATEAFVAGFDGLPWDHNPTKKMYEKGRRVYRLVRHRRSRHADNR